MKITIEISDRFAVELYGLLEKQMTSAKECIEDENFAKKHPSLTERCKMVCEGCETVMDAIMEEL